MHHPHFLTNMSHDKKATERNAQAIYSYHSVCYRPDQALYPDKRLSLAEFALAGIRKGDFVIMIGLEEAEHTLMDRAKRIGKASLPIDLASIPKL